MKSELRFLLVLLLASMAGSASAQLFVISNANFNGSVAMLGYNFDGTSKNVTSLLTDPRGLATDGTNLFVADYTLGVVGEYTTSGSIVNPSLISGLTGPLAMAVSGTNLFVGDNSRIGEYSTSGIIVNANLVTNIQTAMGLAVIGTNLFASNFNGGKIGQYTTSGATMNASLVSGLSSPWGLATDGTNLFVYNSGNGTVGIYNTSGGAVSPVLITGLGAHDLTIIGTNIFLLSNGVTIGQYSTSGATVNASLITAGHWLWGIAAVPITTTAPPPATGITMYSNQPVVIWPATAGNYVLQTTTNLVSGNWVAVTNYMPITGAMITNATSPAFFRLH
jgi:hypothetical protein